MSDALAICKSAMETNNPSVVSDYTLQLEPEFRDVRYALEKLDVSVLLDVFLLNVVLTLLSLTLSDAGEAHRTRTADRVGGIPHE